jgi:hypothetical protein
MKPEDSQIDVLLKRYGGRAKSGAVAGHLDADELNAFAERSAPAAARSRYVSHLAECDVCRGLATQLSIAAGATVSASAGAVEAAKGSFWEKLTSFLAPPKLRYAAFAAVLVAAVGVTFLALRHQRSDSSLVAQNERATEKQVSAVKPAEPSAPEAREKAQTAASPSGAVPQATANPISDLKKDESKVADYTTAPPKPEKEAAASADQPVFAEKRAAEPVIAKQGEARQQQPSYAPQPPGESGRAQTQSREQRDERRVAAASGPRKAEAPSDKLKDMDRSAGGILQNRQAEGDDVRARNNQAMTNQQRTNQQNQNNRALDSNAAGPAAGNLAMNRSGNEEKTEVKKKPATAVARSDSEKAPETRSVAGHKFRRQGNAWVDMKFKTSMPTTNVSRGSDEFRSLDSELRAIAGQLSGEVIVVRKGKAYRIH